MALQSSGHPSILILTGNFGDGHKQAASALAEAAYTLNPSAKVTIIDIMEQSLPRMHRFTQLLYMLWITKLPWLYGYLYQQSKMNTLLSRCLKRLPLCSLTRLRRLLAATKPDIVISTFPSAAAAMSKLKAYGWSPITTATVITDHTYHSYWIHPGTDLYLVGSEPIRAALKSWPVPDSAISVTGIPVRSQFGRLADRTEILHKYKLDPKLPTVMIMGGGYGLIGGDWAKLLNTPPLLHTPKQIIIVCGRNTELQAKLKRELSAYPHRCLITGFVEHVHELMAAADLLVTKPGGLTTSEAICSGLPMLLYKPLPGQEWENADYLTSAGVAVQADNPSSFVLQLDRLLHQPELLKLMKANTHRLAMKDSAVQAILRVHETAGAPAPSVVHPKPRLAKA